MGGTMMRVQPTYGSVIRFVGEKTKWRVEPMDGHNVAFQDINSNELEVQTFGLDSMTRMLIAEMDGERLLYEIPIISDNGERDWQHWNTKMFDSFESAVEFTRKNLNEFWKVDELHLKQLEYESEKVNREEPAGTKSDNMLCPLCGADSLYYAKVAKGRDGAGEMDYTHAWSCEDCPVIIFEYYDKKDIKNLKKMNYNYCGVIESGVYVDVVKESAIEFNRAQLEKFGYYNHLVTDSDINKINREVVNPLVEIELSHTGEKILIERECLKLTGSEEE